MTAELLTLSHKTETDAMHWMLLQAYLGRSVSITHEGREARLVFGGEIDAEQFVKFLNSAKARAPQMKIPENNNAGSRRRSPSLTE